MTIKTQAQFDAAVKRDPSAWHVLVEGFFRLEGNARAVLRENASAELWGNARAVLWENARAELRGNARAELWGNASAELRGNARAELRGNARAVLRENARAELWGNASAVLRENASAELRENARAVLRGNARAVLRENARAVLRENARAELRGNASAKASGFAFLRVFSALKIEASAQVIIALHGKAKAIKGGVQIKQTPPKTPRQWCEHHGVSVEKGIATLYKALNDDFTSPRGMSYAPGTAPTAPDWDGGKAECGGGLHFSPTPRHAREFHRDAKRYAACPVRLKDMVVHLGGDYPEKVKARQVAQPCYEVTIDGERVKP